LPACTIHTRPPAPTIAGRAQAARAAARARYGRTTAQRRAEQLRRQLAGDDPRLGRPAAPRRNGGRRGGAGW
jgi:hypothetical protein